jgi:sorting nexin-25
VHYSPAEHQHHHHHNSPVRVKTTIDDDGMSDASYYAMPRNKHRSDSMSSASASESGSPGRRRSASLNYRNRQNHPFPSTDAVRPGHHRTPSFQGQAHEHSPISPSPLARAPFVKDKDKETRSPLAPTRDRETNDNVDDQLAPERGRGRKHSQLRHAPGSLSDSESIPPRRRHHSRALERENENHDHSQRHGQEHEHRHHRHRSTSQVPPLNRVPSPLPSIQGRHDGPAPPSLAAASYIPPIDLQDAYEGRAHESRRRRALSFQGFEAPPMVPYQTPSIAGMGPVMAYDDGVSIAGSQMTFMDGSVGGRVSQYGLPKYAHQPKVDWRR